jgi:hypothetical protein
MEDDENRTDKIKETISPIIMIILTKETQEEFGSFFALK